MKLRGLNAPSDRFFRRKLRAASARHSIRRFRDGKAPSLGSAKAPTGRGELRSSKGPPMPPPACRRSAPRPPNRPKPSTRGTVADHSGLAKACMMQFGVVRPAERVNQGKPLFLGRVGQGCRPAPAKAARQLGARPGRTDRPGRGAAQFAGTHQPVAWRRATCRRSLVRRQANRPGWAAPDSSDPGKQPHSLNRRYACEGVRQALRRSTRNYLLGR